MEIVHALMTWAYVYKFHIVVVLVMIAVYCAFVLGLILGEERENDDR